MSRRRARAPSCVSGAQGVRPDSAVATSLPVRSGARLRPRRARASCRRRTPDRTWSPPGVRAARPSSRGGFEARHPARRRPSRSGEPSQCWHLRRPRPGQDSPGRRRAGQFHMRSRGHARWAAQSPRHRCSKPRLPWRGSTCRPRSATRIRRKAPHNQPPRNLHHSTTRGRDRAATRILRLALCRAVSAKH